MTKVHHLENDRLQMLKEGFCSSPLLPVIGIENDVNGLDVSEEAHIESSHNSEQHCFSAYILLVDHNIQVIILTLELLPKIWMLLKLRTVISQPVIHHHTL